MADSETTFHQVARVGGQSATDKEEEEKEEEEAFNTPVSIWHPQSGVVDLGGGLQAGLARLVLARRRGIDVRSVATQGHWQVGVVERQQAWWKSIRERAVRD